MGGFLFLAVLFLRSHFETTGVSMRQQVRAYPRWRNAK